MILSRTARPDILGAQPRKSLGNAAVAIQSGRRVSALESAMVDGDDFIGGLAELRVDGTLEALLDDLLEIHRLVLGLGHLKHKRPVGSLLSLVARGGVTVDKTLRLELGTGGGNVLVGVMGEDRAAVEGAIILGVVQPALEIMGIHTTETETLHKQNCKLTICSDNFDGIKNKILA